MFDLKDKVVLVTGGEGGLGGSICNTFIKMGARVLVTTTKKKLTNKRSRKNTTNWFKKYFNNPKQVLNFNER